MVLIYDVLRSPIGHGGQRIAVLGQAFWRQLSQRRNLYGVACFLPFRKTFGGKVGGPLDSGVNHQERQPTLGEGEADLVAIQRAAVKEDCTVVFTQERRDVIAESGFFPYDGILGSLTDFSQ